MTVEEIEARIQQLAALREPEAAASGEASLWYEVLFAIAHGAPEPVQLASAALRTTEHRLHS